MLPDRILNPGNLALESDMLSTALRSQLKNSNEFICMYLLYFG